MVAEGRGLVGVDVERVGADLEVLHRGQRWGRRVQRHSEYTGQAVTVPGHPLSHAVRTHQTQQVTHFNQSETAKCDS